MKRKQPTHYVIVRHIARYPAVADTWSVVVHGSNEALSHHESESEARSAREQYKQADRRRARQPNAMAAFAGIGILLAATANANAQGMRDCLANAASEYKRSWLSHCPGGVQYNFPACALGPAEAAEAKADWATARSLCWENRNAEAADRADEAQRGPGLTQDEPALPADNEPRRKFWISPQ